MQRSRQLILFFAAVAFMSAATGVHDSIFNNFLSDTFSMNADQRGWLEFPRELPGFAVVFMTGLLCMLPVTQLGVVGTFGYFVGMMGMAFLGTYYHPMIGWMILASSGMHLLQPVGSSVALGLSDAKAKGRRMGQMAGFETIGRIVGTGFVWLFFANMESKYRTGFLCAGALAFVASMLYMRLHIPHLHESRSRFVFKRKFSLYYILESLYGARKQIFITFGPWILIKLYKLDAADVAGLMMIAALIGIVFKPLMGMAVDRFGERRILILDGFTLVFVCVGYGYAGYFFDSPSVAKFVVCACFIADELLFSLSSARAVYLSRISANSQELTSTLSMGVSINHIASMTIPMFAGYVWLQYGPERVFLAGAVLAIILSVLSSWVPSKKSYAGL